MQRHMHCTFATVWLQVCSRHQVAVMFVHMYPYVPSVETTLNTLATVRGEPSKQQLSIAALANPMAAEWNSLEEYVQQVVKQDPYAYAPVPHAITSCNATSSHKLLVPAAVTAMSAACSNASGVDMPTKPSKVRKHTLLY